ncbi:MULTISPECIES: beta-glucosidase [unclassified Crossiella]|uniref:beta-glucosidase family protein n=1 Tax=unclassified Crossiella TaxID=2620835 RepID=UPI002000337A|nr:MULTISPECIES: glycoside hydrolase family 3 C-terminal domain-containing protein [unclassified Crossiella]MCK2240407.1 glycoside hydrolase family 3 C-terminal domain-containing protein [Crossiella sp. S99.2]MCK2253141.1 glycoside hydrolase family 3 C-terminal domain-containing protein [Crossiella sp. S99.1]
MRTLRLALVLTLSAAATLPAAASAAVPPEVRARAVVAQLTLDEKIAQLHGIRTEAQYRVVPGLARLKIPPLLVTNGPAGVGPGDVVQPSATALPAPISLAATWDTAAAHRYGDLLGKETRHVGRNLMEAPTVNIARVPVNGRTFEGYGEDPYLVSRLAVDNIRGIERNGIMGNVKHYLGNNQEQNRFKVNDIIDERTLREIYLPAFEASVKEAGVDSVMCAFPRINGTFSCENHLFLTKILKQEWGFQGFVTSDFGAVHSTVPTANAGLDVEMPTGKFFGAELKKAVQAGQVSTATLDDKLIRRYTTMIRAGLFDKPATVTPIPAREHGAIARDLSARGMVLLRNEGGLLPLSAKELRSVALIGPFATEAKTGGGGSSKVKPLYTVPPLDGLRAKLPADAKVTLHDGADLAAATAAAAAAQVAVVMVGDNQTEGRDKPNLSLEGQQDALVKAVAAANPRTVVVVKSGGPVLMPWLAQAPAVLQAWYPGQEDGNAVADVLFGAVNPEGRLPITFPRAEGDVPANTPERYPGIGVDVRYSEGIFVGYRHYDAKGVEPLFPFGFGLSYTSFDYRGLTARRDGDKVRVSVEVRNTGSRAGVETVQLYVGDPGTAAAPEPPSQLQGFAKATLEAGQAKRVELTLDARSFSYWDTGKHRWRVAPGEHKIMVGASSRDLRLHTSVRLPEN